MKTENILLDHVTWLEGKNYSPGYIAGIVTSIKSWLDYNHIEVRRKIKVTNASVPVSIQDEQILTTAQLRQILNAATPRGRAVISMLVFAGVRPQVLGLTNRSDGLRLSDIPDLVIDGNSISFSQTPAMVTVRPQLSKTRNKYFTFLAREGCEYVLGYLQQRMAHGEKLRLKSALVTVDTGYHLKGWHKLNPDVMYSLIDQISYLESSHHSCAALLFLLHGERYILCLKLRVAFLQATAS